MEMIRTGWVTGTGDKGPPQARDLFNSSPKPPSWTMAHQVRTNRLHVPYSSQTKPQGPPTASPDQIIVKPSKETLLGTSAMSSVHRMVRCNPNEVGAMRSSQGFDERVTSSWPKPSSHRPGLKLCRPPEKLYVQGAYHIGRVGVLWMSAT
eukprot:scaffold124757_cov17-Tisochrysis_lutea.AAC.1